MSNSAQEILRHFNIHTSTIEKTASDILKKADDICNLLEEALSKAEVMQEFSSDISDEEKSILSVLKNG